MRIEREGSYASELLHSQRTAQLSSADHRLATELVMGVLRWRDWLDGAIAAASARAVEKLDREILVVLRLGAYQLQFLDRIPRHAAIHESVELVKRARKRSAAPFANAVLRKLPSMPPDLLQKATSASDLAERYSHPEWLVARWVQTYGLQHSESICGYDQQVPRTCIRFRNSSVEQELYEQGIQLAPGELLSSAKRVLAGDITTTQAFQHGRISIQDEASQLIALLVGKGRILDCCAAPGGKTAILAEKNPASEIISVELHPHRARLLRSRMDAVNVRIVAADARRLPFSGKFDSVLVDAPCSGTGTLARNPDIKWKLSAADLDDLTGRQLEILRSAGDKTVAGGQLIYATCSLEIEENSGVIEQFLSGNQSFTIIDCRHQLDKLRAEGELVWGDPESLLMGPFLRTVPGVHPCDGFFAAVLQRV